eukprot:CAMPEP_0174372430 /NCGR_PEP_ID=MMETSP0811_2-20130205/103598_1 /TAXON_ID=73025 ORGANISM="Eutreptiella gymnastica-like, Strain CCMP1594" /NCGR_SAMPLE_ID=MMETSP0811_2 /ASSEMBLY_ACC=CAM_ASM_000667 /LENGTH=58 /DNA_ID=CAMNT_0015519847 /DNA_START=302 /DNA_END=475 /DNA_ORIENTATION=-
MSLPWYTASVMEPCPPKLHSKSYPLDPSKTLSPVSSGQPTGPRAQIHTIHISCDQTQA